MLWSPWGAPGLIIAESLQFKNLRIPDQLAENGPALSNLGFKVHRERSARIPINVKNGGLVSSVGRLGLRNSVVKAIRARGGGEGICEPTPGEDKAPVGGWSEPDHGVVLPCSVERGTRLE